MSVTQFHNKQLEQKFQQLEGSIYDNNKLLNASVSALQSAIKPNEQLDSMRNERDYMSSRLRKLEEEIEKRERYSRRSNMLLYGMKEEAGESFDRCATRVLQVLCPHFPHTHTHTKKKKKLERDRH